MIRFHFDDPTAYGGTLLKKRRGRSHARPVATAQTMHVVLRASKNAGDKPFKRGPRRDIVQALLRKFAARHKVELRSFSVNLNHVHLHAKFQSRATYVRFIRAVSSAIAMAIAGTNRWNKSQGRFWELRPFTRVIIGALQEKRIRDYILLNEYESLGYTRAEARFQMAWDSCG